MAGICDKCREAADTDMMPLHLECAGKGKCNCQHKHKRDYPVEHPVASVDISSTPVTGARDVKNF